MSVTAIRLEMDTEQMQKIFGMQDAYIKKLEQDFQVTIVDRNGSVMITGEEENASKASRVLRQLTALSDHGNEIEEQSVDYAIEMGKEDQEEKLMEMDADCICHTISGKPIKPKTLGQKAYVDAIRKQMIVFGIGPAGTGKTYLAMAMAITAFKNGVMDAKPVLLEPIVNLKVDVLDKNTGDVMGDLNKRRGRVLGMTPDHQGNTIIEADVPQLEIYGYSTYLRSMTGGSGDFSYEFARYEQAPGDIQQKEIEARASKVDAADE